MGIMILAAAGYFGFKYYQDTYTTEVAYAIVPEQVPEKVPTKDSAGKVQDGLYSYHYSLQFVTEDGGKVETREYELSSENPEPFTPNAYVTAEVSKNRIVNGPNGVSESDIPEKVLQKLTDLAN